MKGKQKTNAGYSSYFVPAPDPSSSLGISLLPDEATTLAALQTNLDLFVNASDHSDLLRKIYLLIQKLTRQRVPPSPLCKHRRVPHVLALLCDRAMDPHGEHLRSGEATRNTSVMLFHVASTLKSMIWLVFEGPYSSESLKAVKDLDPAPMMREIINSKLPSKLLEAAQTFLLAEIEDSDPRSYQGVIEVSLNSVHVHTCKKSSLCQTSFRSLVLYPPHV